MGENSCIEQSEKRPSLEFNEVNLEEIKRLIIPEGPCKFLNVITPRTDSFASYLERDTDDLSGEPILYSTNLEKETEKIRFILGRLFADIRFIRVINVKDPNQELSKEELSPFLELSEQDVLPRLYLILNYNIDPELLPFALEYGYKKHGNFYNMPKVLENLIRENAEIRLKLAELMADRLFTQEIFTRKEKQRLSPEVLKKISSFIEKCISSAPTLSDTEKFRIKYYLENNFFDLGGFNINIYSDSIRTLIADIQRITADVYFKFQDVFFKPDFQDGGWSLRRKNKPNSNIRNSLSKFAHSVETGSYLLTIWKEVLTLYQFFFKDVYSNDITLLVKGLGIQMPYVEEETRRENVIEDANGSYGNGEIRIKSGTIIREKQAEDISKEETVSVFDQRIPRRINDLIILVHELSHAIYEDIVHNPYTKYPEDYYEKVDSAINEGFCVLMELLFIDFLKEEKHLLDVLGFDNKDIQVLEDWKRGRLSYLKDAKNAYTEGTFKIMHKIYRKAAGEVTSRNFREGLQAVKKFLEGLDSSKTLSTLRMDEEFQRLLREKDPSQVWHVLSRPLSEPYWEKKERAGLIVSYFLRNYSPDLLMEEMGLNPMPEDDWVRLFCAAEVAKRSGNFNDFQVCRTIATISYNTRFGNPEGIIECLKDLVNKTDGLERYSDLFYFGYFLLPLNKDRLKDGREIRYYDEAGKQLMESPVYSEFVKNLLPLTGEKIGSAEISKAKKNIQKMPDSLEKRMVIVLLESLEKM